MSKSLHLSNHNTYRPHINAGVYIGILATVATLGLGMKALKNSGVACEGEQQITVGNGDTVWGYAGALNPTGEHSTQAIVAEIIDMNDSLTPRHTNLRPGEQVSVPRSC